MNKMMTYNQGMQIICEAKSKLAEYVSDISVFPYIFHAWRLGLFGKTQPKQDPIKVLAGRIFDAYRPVSKAERRLFQAFLPQLMELSETEAASYYLTCVLVDFTKIDDEWYVTYADRLSRDLFSK